MQHMITANNYISLIHNLIYNYINHPVNQHNLTTDFFAFNFSLKFVTCENNDINY